jgi:adenylate cyclase
MNISKELVLSQLDRICESEDFVNKVRMQNLLKYIVTEFLAGRENQLKGYSIGVDVFEQGDDFDPDYNALVRINMGRLRRLLQFYYLDKGVNDPVVIDIPKGKYIPIFTTQTTPKSPSPEPRSSEQYFEYMATRVLVVPLQNVNAGSELDFFIHGISHELGTSLSKLDDIQLLRYSNFDGKSESIEELLQTQPNVDFVIEGDLSVFRNKAQLKIRLIEVESKSQIWGQGFTLDLDSDNLLDLQDQLAKEIAMVLGSEYGHINSFKMQELIGTNSTLITEQKALMHYYAYLTTLSEQAHNELFQMCTSGLKEYPTSAILQALTGNVYGNIYMLGISEDENAYSLFGDLIESAYKAKPTNQLIKAILAFKCFAYNEKSRFMALVNDGIQQAESSPLKSGSWAMYLSLFGEWERGKEIMDKIKQHNLDFPKWLYSTSCLYFFKDKHYEKALEEANLYQIHHFFWAPMLRAATLGHLNRKTEAYSELQTLLQWRPDFKDQAELLISRYIKQPSLVGAVMEGLHKAGL